ncbi:hypothetical protein D9613_002014 [Agrocybe pediades]|uniref:Autophagy-related protein 14 n=1 Tax=Agrocybe pediades TaxID=84607 RepID=A0A8H4R7I5_9AGAR|nr:hypothetical protein D9613_002014 [Agrocybe pediades]
MVRAELAADDVEPELVSLQIELVLCKTPLHSMLPSATPSAVESVSETGEFTLIRNLTPFPVRDSFTSALTQPVEQPYFVASGATDDLGTIVSRKRSRRKSVASNSTLHGLKKDEERFDTGYAGFIEPRPRKSSSSTITYPSNANISTSPDDTTLSPSTSSRSATVRRNRPRTSSMTSFGITQASNGLQDYTTSGTIFSLFAPSHSQTELKRIIDSRLIETFITVFIPPCQEVAGFKDEPKPLRSAPISKSSFSPVSSRFSQTTPTPSRQFTSETSLPKNPKVVFPDSAPPSRTSFKSPRGNNSTVKSKQTLNSRANGVSTVLEPSFARDFPSSSKTTTTSRLDSTLNTDEPAYISPIHRPSTNPVFPVDGLSSFPSWLDTGGQHMRLEVWGRSVPEKTRLLQDLSEEWKLLDEWEFDLDRLVPVPAESDLISSSLPSNTLVISLLPPGQLFYLPSRSNSSRSSTPSAGYTSDPESAIRKVKQASDQPESNSIKSQDEAVSRSRRRLRKVRDSMSRSKDTVKTAGWQDLFKYTLLYQQFLAMAYSCITDNELSVSEVIQKIDEYLDEDKIFPLKREISEREASVAELRRDHHTVVAETERKRREIEERRQRLEERRVLLESAFDEDAPDPQMNSLIEEERRRWINVSKDLETARTNLLSALSTIYPIELYSPPDLLYTILDVPLPIPVSPNDPAPPLSDPNHKDITEEAIATALGYVAQVLQIMAAYIGKKLIYPVTCIGSRSLIKDGISAMVGPRMFPLFSKGVDTYRFEYGVFLLNKDIEMLMAERDLRALDIRHTLPNLKNLILTLSHGANPTERRIRVASPILITSVPDTNAGEHRQDAEDVSTPKASRTLDFHIRRTESTTPPQSGSATPTTVTDESRKPKSFLGFVPFSDYL